ALDTGEIDVAPGTDELRPGDGAVGVVVGLDGDGLAAVFAAEVERVEAAATGDRVIAVTRIPDERFVAGAEVRQVVAFTAHNGVVAGGGVEDVVAGAAGEGVSWSAIVAVGAVDDSHGRSAFKDLSAGETRPVDWLRETGPEWALAGPMTTPRYISISA